MQAPAAARWVKHAFRQFRRNRAYITPLKLINIGLVHLQYALRTELVLGRPYEVNIEPTNVCTGTCRLCPSGQGHVARQKGVMPWERYKALIDETRRWVYKLNLSLWGDPLTTNQIYAMIRYAHAAGIWTSLSSNLHAFEPDNGDDVALVQSGLDHLMCSLHAASQQTYEDYQPGKNFEQNIAKIRRLVATRDRLGSSTPRICLNFVVTRINEHEIEAFRGLARELGCEANFSPPSLNLRFISPSETPRVRDEIIEDRLNHWLPLDPAYVNEPYRMMREKRALLDDFSGGPKRFKCAWLWKRTVVNWDGSVAPCYGSRDKAFDFADLSVNRFGQIWNGPSYRAARRTFKTRTDADVICARCSGIML